jgi:membrane carboxypeptidase/penicillin-binding protein
MEINCHAACEHCRMKLLHKMFLAIASLALLLAAGVGSWLFLYTGDLPDFDHLSQFAPSTQSVVSDRCLVSPSTSIPFERIGEPLKNALATAEPAQSMPHQIARSLMCNHSGGMGKYHLNAIRLSWHIRMHFSEHQIFTIYANRAYFGEGITGVERASQEFFHKEPDALNVGEAALIAGSLRGPLYSPRRHPERAFQRRNKVLEEMVAQGKLSTAEASKLEASPIAIQ